MQQHHGLILICKHNMSGHMINYLQGTNYRWSFFPARSHSKQTVLSHSSSAVRMVRQWWLPDSFLGQRNSSRGQNPPFCALAPHPFSGREQKLGETQNMIKWVLPRSYHVRKRPGDLCQGITPVHTIFLDGVLSMRTREVQPSVYMILVWCVLCKQSIRWPRILCLRIK